nr:helix-turn-helix transcriptional regulator [Enterococcus faecalis]
MSTGFIKLANFLAYKLKIKGSEQINMSQDLAIDVRAALIRAGKNQSWLAKQLGISSPYLSDILHGRRRSEEQVQKIKKILNIK